MTSNRVFHARIGDLDRPLHRIFPVWHLEQLCQIKHLTLVKPSLWIDPREDPCALFMLTPQPGAFRKPQRQLADYLAVCWAQCWSYEADSDVLLRAYSRVLLDPVAKRNTTPAEEGVRVTSTPRRLIAAMEQWADRSTDCHFYIAAVNYEPEETYAQNLVNRLAGPDGPRYFSTPGGRAESLCVKRDQFRHEDEVRILCVGPGKLGTGEPIRRFPADPNTLLSEISFDPRLLAFERIEREQRLRHLGFTGSIRADTSYDKVINLIPMAAEWPDPEWDRTLGCLNTPPDR